MFIFIDESGDSGLKFDLGSSRYFVVALVIFNDKEEAMACQQRIELLKQQLRWVANSEFHFKRNSDQVRRVFLQVVAKYHFVYQAIVIDKVEYKLQSEVIRGKNVFFQYACGLAFQDVKEVLINSIVVIDENGNPDFRNQLAKYLRNTINNQDTKAIKKVTMQRSHGNNLIQLADYVAGVIHRSVLQQHKNYEEYRDIIRQRELEVKIWPK